MRIKRVFLIVLDSLGIGAMPDADRYGDAGSNTLAAIARHPSFRADALSRLGLFAIDGLLNLGPVPDRIRGSYARMAERSMGKDTTTGHWEIAGVISERALPTFPEGFPAELLNAWAARTGRGWLCNRPYSGTEVIKDYGREHVETGKLIVYTSADSVFQVAAHESVVPIDALYSACSLAREMLTGPYAVGRVIARPFEGAYPDFRRTTRRHDFSLAAPGRTMLDALSEAGLSSIGVGKIGDIFASRGVTASYPTAGNAEGMERTARIQAEDFTGLCFVNLVDTDMLYGHRNDVAGYAAAVAAIDAWLGAFLPGMRREDVLMITADHGCDPSTASTDHSREYAPLLVYGEPIREGVNLGTRPTFADIAQSILDGFGLPALGAGQSFLPKIRKG